MSTWSATIEKPQDKRKLSTVSVKLKLLFNCALVTIRCKSNHPNKINNVSLYIMSPYISV